MDEGTAGLYVRTEQRASAEQPEHLLIVTHDRYVFERWEDPAEFGERWTVSYTPPADPMEGHGLRREHAAFVATFKDAPDLIAEAIGTAEAGAHANAALAAMRERFREHRAAAR